MPPKARTPEEKQRDKDRIINAALAIVQKHGLEALSIRRLSSNLNMSSTNIYNYFYNKEEIYFHILICGFDTLLADLNGHLESEADPLRRLEIFIRRFAAFGEDHAAYYQLMFSTLDPKCMDYIGTPLEALACHEKRIAMRTYELLESIVHACDPLLSGDELRSEAIRTGFEIHGFVCACHTHILRELGGNYDKVLDSTVKSIVSGFKK